MSKQKKTVLGYIGVAEGRGGSKLYWWAREGLFRGTAYLKRKIARSKSDVDWKIHEVVLGDEVKE